MSISATIPNQTASILSPNDKSKLKRWRVSTFWVMLLGYVGYYLCRGNLPAAFPLIGREFSYTNSELGLIAAYSEIAYAIGKFINGPLSDKVGGRKIFLLGMIGAIFFNVLFGLSSSLIAFILVWCFCRYFLSMGWGGLTKTIGAWYPAEKNGTVMGFISLNFQFGGVIATLFAGMLVAMGYGWREIFFIPAGVLAVIFIWSYFASKSKPSDVIPGFSYTKQAKLHGVKAKQPLADLGGEDEVIPVKEIIRKLLRLRVFQTLLAFSFFATFLRSVFFFWTPKFLVDIGMGESNAILKSALFPFLGALGTVLLGWYTDTRVKNGDRARIMWISLSGLVVSLLGLAYYSHQADPNHTIIVTLTGLCGFFLLGPYAMVSGCLTLDIAGSKGAGSCTGMLDGVGYLGGAIAAFGAGVLSDQLGWSEVFLFLAGFAVLATVCAYLLSRNYQRIAIDQN